MFGTNIILKNFANLGTIKHSLQITILLLLLSIMKESIKLDQNLYYHYEETVCFY